MTKPLPKCADCINAKEKVQPTVLICKKNCVQHSPQDYCMMPKWFEAKEPINSCTTCPNVSMNDGVRIGALKQWLRDNIEYEDYVIANNLGDVAPRIQRGCWYSVLEKIEEREKVRK